MDKKWNKFYEHFTLFLLYAHYKYINLYFISSKSTQVTESHAVIILNIERLANDMPQLQAWYDHNLR